METWYFTFGCSHQKRNSYVRVQAPDCEKARSLMIEVYGTNWAFCYSDVNDIHPDDQHEADVLIHEPQVQKWIAV